MPSTLNSFFPHLISFLTISPTISYCCIIIFFLPFLCVLLSIFTSIFHFTSCCLFFSSSFNSSIVFRWFYCSLDRIFCYAAHNKRMYIKLHDNNSNNNKKSENINKQEMRENCWFYLLELFSTFFAIFFYSFCSSVFLFAPYIQWKLLSVICQICIAVSLKRIQQLGKEIHTRGHIIIIVETEKTTKLVPK